MTVYEYYIGPIANWAGQRDSEPTTAERRRGRPNGDIGDMT